MIEMDVLKQRLISLTSSKAFQVIHYRKRQWVPHVLAGCRDQEQAFCNWMDRDVLFATEVREQCRKHQYASIVNDGMVTLEAGRSIKRAARLLQEESQLRELLQTYRTALFQASRKRSWDRSLLQVELV